MKLAIVTLAALVALCSALPSHRLPANRGLKEDFQKFLALVPTDKIMAIAMDYLANDAEVQNVIVFLQSDDFKSLILDVEAIPEYNDFVKFLTSQGLDVVGYINKLHEILGLPEFIVSRVQFRRGSGIRGLIDDIKAVLPIDDIKALYYETLKNSPDFANLVNVLKSDEFKGLVAKLRANPTFQDIVEQAREQGVDIELIIDLLNKMFGWGIEDRSMSFKVPATRGLKEDFQKFLALIPTDKIMAIAMDYLANDAEVQNVIVFLQSDDFKSLILDVEAIPEYNDFVKFLTSQGLDVVGYINKLHEILGLPEFIVSRVQFRRGSGIRGLIDDIKAVLPIDDIKALYYETLKNSPDFANLVNVLKSDEFKGLVAKLRANPTFQDIVEQAREQGVDIELIIDLLNKMFGWGIEDRSMSFKVPATRGLKEDFQKFLALIPTDKIMAIAMDYLANDAEVQNVIVFLQSDDFKSLILDVEAIPEYNDFVKFLTSQGLDVVGYINKLHEILGLPEFIVSRVQFRRGSGIRGLIDDIKAVLPIDDIKALYYETLKNSPDFANLVNVLKSDEFKGLVTKLRANPTFQDIVEQAREQGVDIELIIDLLNKIFGWGIEDRSMSVFGLQDDLQDFLALVPTDQVLAIAMDYLANDAEVQGVVEFAQSDDFKNLVLEVDEIPEYIKFLNTLQSKGLDVYTFVNALHDFLGLPALPVPSRMVTRRGQGLRGLIDDIKAILPIEKIKALFYEKLASSPDFAGLVEFMKSNEFQTIVKALQANPKFQEIIENAKGHGIDVQLIIDLLHKIFGWDLEY